MQEFRHEKALNPKKEKNAKQDNRKKEQVSIRTISIIMAAGKNKSGRQPEKSILSLSALNQFGKLPEFTSDRDYREK